MAKFWAFRNVAEGEGPAEMLVYGVVGDAWDGTDEKAFAQDLARVTAPELRVRVNSVGGDLFAGVAIYNALRAHPATVTVVVEGLAASAASVVAMAGDRIVVRRGAMMMVHAPAMLAIGQAEDLRQAAEVLEKARDGIVDIYAARTGRPADEIRGLVDAETWMTAQEAVEQRFADAVDEEAVEADPQLRAEGALVIVNGVSFPTAGHRALVALAARLRPAPDAAAPAPTGMTREQLAASAPALLEALLQEGRTQGAAAERARLESIDELALIGHDALVAAAKYGDEPLSAEALALRVVLAEREARAKYLADRVQDAASVNVPPAPLVPDSGDAARRRLIDGAAARVAARRGGGRS